MACKTGEACGLTDTRSSGDSSANHSAAMMSTMEAEDAWWPPTFTPPGFGLPWFAASTMAVESQRTRVATSRRTFNCTALTHEPSGSAVLVASLSDVVKVTPKFVMVATAHPAGVASKPRREKQPGITRAATACHRTIAQARELNDS